MASALHFLCSCASFSALILTPLELFHLQQTVLNLLLKLRATLGQYSELKKDHKIAIAVITTEIGVKVQELY